MFSFYVIIFWCYHHSEHLFEFFYIPPPLLIIGENLTLCARTLWWYVSELNNRLPCPKVTMDKDYSSTRKKADDISVIHPRCHVSLLLKNLFIVDYMHLKGQCHQISLAWKWCSFKGLSYYMRQLILKFFNVFL